MTDTPARAATARGAPLLERDRELAQPTLFVDGRRDRPSGSGLIEGYKKLGISSRQRLEAELASESEALRDTAS